MRDEQHRNAALFDGADDFGEPVIATQKVAVIPGLQQTLLLRDSEVFGQPILPRLVKVAVADENCRCAHCSIPELACLLIAERAVRATLANNQELRGR